MSSQTEWVPDEWVQVDLRPKKGDEACECHASKQREARYWERTVLVPEGWRPVDIIEAYPYPLPSPLPQAGHWLNKRDVECIASAMADPSLRREKMGHFSIAPFEVSAQEPDEVNSLGYNPHDYDGQMVFTAGHHRFLAYLLCGVPPSELPPIQFREMPITVPYLFPWSILVWGK